MKGVKNVMYSSKKRHGDWKQLECRKQVVDTVDVFVKEEDEGEDEIDGGCISWSGISSLKVRSQESLYSRSPQESLELRSSQESLSQNVGLSTDSTGIHPTTEIWPGDHGFTFQIEDSGNWKKRGYAYSHQLKKLYIDIEKQVALKIYLTSPPPPDYKIRCLPVYVDVASKPQPVLRCPVHYSPSDPTNRGVVDPDILRHLVRTPESGVVYHEDPVSGRLSLTTQVKTVAPGCDYFTIVLQFLCLGSCLGGLARRQLQLIFTLETGGGKVVGRQGMEVRICSCPLRDMKQEETKMSKINNQMSTIQNQMSNTQNSPQILRPQVPSPVEGYGTGGEDVFWVPVIGLNNYQQVNKYAEYLDLTSSIGSCYTEPALNLKRERDLMVRKANSGNSYLIKRRRMEDQTPGPVIHPRMDETTVLPPRIRENTIFPSSMLVNNRIPGETTVVPPMMVVNNKTPNDFRNISDSSRMNVIVARGGHSGGVVTQDRIKQEEDIDDQVEEEDDDSNEGINELRNKLFSSSGDHDYDSVLSI